MTRRIAVMFILLLALGLSGQAESDETLALAQQTLADRVEFLKWDEDAPDPFVRAAYEITMPGTLPEAIEPYYGGYERVIVLEYGFYEFYPIVSSELLAVGIKADGSMEECKTPSDLMARTYDLEPIKALTITPLPLES